jgi:hypothetical protein
MEPLELSFEVECPVEHAFDLWARRTSMWRPSGHSVSADPDLTVTFEPRVGGRIFERTTAGEEHDWGEVLVWEPPRRLVYLSHLRFDRADATEVDVSFEAQGRGHGGEDRASRVGAAGLDRRGAPRAQ